MADPRLVAAAHQGRGKVASESHLRTSARPVVRNDPRGDLAGFRRHTRRDPLKPLVLSLALKAFRLTPSYGAKCRSGANPKASGPFACTGVPE
jgi:hypothetical protein